eukprot:CAMPEP_0118812348 /NCGR_PEP_ID=MMETSP1162-20130426/2239_1 /TAXON_ID=33656 /ORGANISM="Phaeocystis Sp, Strain CCMP2710" /LENGTH=358 /DNA_ID=CAMNT_0006742067 /DNA_START=31 /DNA_END=1107 /DNA_ORIENTATION=-
MPRHFARPHIGRVPMKFYFRAQDINIQLPGHDTCGKLVVVWKRGPRRTETAPIEVKEQLSSVDGSLRRTAATLQDLAIICTMFKNAKTGAFEPKTASFSLREEDEAGEETKLGTVTIDLSAYASPETTTDPVELSFMQGKVLLTLNLSSHWLKHAAAAADDDDASVSSMGSFASDRPDDESDRGGATLKTEEAAAGGAGGSSSYTPLGAAERARFQAQRDAQIERLWAEQCDQASAQAEHEGILEELRQAREMLSHNRDETAYLRLQVERLSTENRVLRREQRQGKRDEVALQLEMEIEAKEGDRAEMEEQLSAAFGGVIKELQARVTSLVSERDALLSRQEAREPQQAGKKTFLSPR